MPRRKSNLSVKSRHAIRQRNKRNKLTEEGRNILREQYRVAAARYRARIRASQTDEERKAFLKAARCESRRRRAYQKLKQLRAKTNILGQTEILYDRLNFAGAHPSPYRGPRSKRCEHSGTVKFSAETQGLNCVIGQVKQEPVDSLLLDCEKPESQYFLEYTPKEIKAESLEEHIFHQTVKVEIIDRSEDFKPVLENLDNSMEVKAEPTIVAEAILRDILISVIPDEFMPRIVQSVSIPVEQFQKIKSLENCVVSLNSETEHFFDESFVPTENKTVLHSGEISRRNRNFARKSTTTAGRKSAGTCKVYRVLGENRPSTSKQSDNVDSKMVCSLCEPMRFFTNRSGLIEHLKTDHVEDLRPYNHKCPVCSKGFDGLRNFLSHLKTCTTPLDLINCGQCGRRFTSNSAYEVHKRSHQPGELKCTHCGGDFNTTSDLVQHVLTHDLDSDTKLNTLALALGGRVSVSSRYSPFKCPDCFRNFTIRAVYKRHLRLAQYAKTLNDPFQCPHCDFQATGVCLLGVHVEAHKLFIDKSDVCGKRGKFEKPHGCGKCQETFRTVNGLVRHELEHEGKLNAMCKLCGGYFRAVSDLKAHARRCVNEKQSFSCGECKRVFASRWRLREHSHCHQPNVYFCDQCGREFKHLQNLNRHVNSKCGTEPWIFCDFCKIGFFSRKSLAAHLRESHTTETMFICQYCSGEFLTRVQLIRHEARHKRIQHQCLFMGCGEIFNNAKILKKHEQKHSNASSRRK